MVQRQEIHSVHRELPPNHARPAHMPDTQLKWASVPRATKKSGIYAQTW